MSIYALVFRQLLCILFGLWYVKCHGSFIHFSINNEHLKNKIIDCRKLTNQLHCHNFRPHYNLNLQSISVNGQTLPIDQSAFSTSSNKGTIVDTGTTLAYLTEAAYDPLINAVGFGEQSFDFLHLTLYQRLRYKALMLCRLRVLSLSLCAQFLPREISVF